TCSRSHACAGSFVRRGCQLMKYGNGLSSRGGSIIRKLVIRFVIFTRVRGTVSTKSVRAIARTAGMKKGILNATWRFRPSAPTCRNLIIRLWSDSAHDQLRVRRVLTQSLEQLGEQNGRAVVGHRHSKAFAALRRNKFLVVHDGIQTPHDRFDLSEDAFASGCA